MLLTIEMEYLWNAYGKPEENGYNVIANIVRTKDIWHLCLFFDAVR